jgi:hypothetical protein
LEAALERLPNATEELLETLDASLERRNEASYAAGVVAQASVDDAREAHEPHDSEWDMDRITPEEANGWEM